MKSLLTIRLKSLVKHPPWGLLATNFLTVLGAVWLLLEFASWVFPSLIPEPIRPAILLITSVTALLSAILVAIPPVSCGKHFPSKSTYVELTVGNILDPMAPHHVSILSSDYFDSCISTAISARSLKGQLVSEFFSGSTGSFDSVVDASLASQNLVGVQNPQKSHGRNRTTQYPIGTTAAIPIGTRKALLVVAARFDDATTKTTTDATSLWVSLLALWQGASTHCVREHIAVPLWGANLGNAPGNRLVLFETLLCSFAAFSATVHQPPTRHLTIIIWPGDYNPEEFRQMASILKRLEI